MDARGASVVGKVAVSPPVNSSSAAVRTHGSYLPTPNSQPPVRILPAEESAKRLQDTEGVQQNDEQGIAGGGNQAPDELAFA